MNSSSSIRPDIERILFTKKQLLTRIGELADQLVADLPDSDEPPIFINIMGGAANFFVHLTEAIGDRGQLIEDFAVFKSYDGEESTGTAKVLIDVRYRITNRDIVIVEDIVDTGITMRAILDLLESRHPRSILICTLLDKAEARIIKDLKIDYTGFRVEKGDFVIGFGLDLDDKYRHLPFVGILKQ